MTELKNQPPSSPVAAATRPPPDSTDAQKRAELTETRRQRHAQKLKDPATFVAPEPHHEQEVAVFVNNGQHNGFRAIGRHFPNGLTTNVPVTEEELAELKKEPQDIIRVVDAAEVASMAGKGGSASLSPDEHRVLAHFRSSGQDSEGYLAHHPKTGTEKSGSAPSSEASSKASGEEHHNRKQK